ncbi:hypothetical protein BDN72DRAFT_899326 [Pluteus cervinus]|uniref:Uncharacterized protein n=1 Tax=Pluteus cervinus TaxID=181527 RepID=A0ACD3AQ60_9AGAR|nr:hypothetical protein BDN72DRAFT_899326 [Pluteus cervinus]
MSATGKRSSSNPIAAELKRLLKRIRKLYRRIRQLKTRLNALAPINRLPPELLIHIFLSLQSNFHEEYAVDYYKWTVITQVSRSWRNLASEAKQLWTVISHDTQVIESPWIAVFLDRSQPVHLDVVVNFDLYSEKLGLLERVAEEKHRIRTLYVNVVGVTDEMREEFRALVHWLVTEMPVLEEFELKGVDEYNTERSPFDLPPTTFFNSLAPRLRSFQVVDINLGLRSLPFNGITTLKLWYGEDHRGELSLRALFAFLCVTHLHVLELQHALFEEDNTEEVDNLMPISLSSLSSLFINSTTHLCTKFLSAYPPI